METKRFTTSRPLVVCLHASGSSSRQWQPLADFADSALDVVAPDLLGHGSAPAWLGAPSGIVTADAARVAALLHADRRAHLCGHSYGAVIALKVALTFPERVKSVTVYEPVMFRALRDFAPRSHEALEAFALGRSVQRDVRGGLAAHAAHRFTDYWSGEGAFQAMPSWRREAVVRRMSAIAAHFAALWSDDMRIADLARSRVPMSLLYGMRTRASVRRIVELVQQARPDAYGGGLTAMAHMGPLTHPGTVAQRFAAEIVAHERRALVAHALAA